MPLKRTTLLSDTPSVQDDFGSHTKIAKLIKGEIIGSDQGRSVALVGDWGSGKSTVIKLIDNEFRDKDSPENPKKSSAHVFIYDAWSHQGDPLRRAFLDDLTAFLLERDLLTEDEASKISSRIWSRVEEVETITEPLLRRHTKILLLMFALIPVGMALFGMSTHQHTWPISLASIHLAGLALLLTPIAWLTALAAVNKFGPGPLKEFLFGIKPENKNFSVLSFFFEKIHGTIEKKHVRSPLDSIIEFKSVFADILDKVQRNKQGSRVVIIIDNIDRIPAEQARDFWSTMQTFFAEDGGMRKPKTSKYWLIVPFSVQALSFIFRDEVTGQTNGELTLSPIAKAKAYIDKTFSIAFFVPTPIDSGWRKYLLDQLKIAFPEHPTNELSRVRNIFDFAKPRPFLSITPRELKLFVNSLVVLYRQRFEDISLPVLASFILHRDAIAKTGITAELLSTQERRLIETKDWQLHFSALQYGTSIDEGAQILMLEPTLTALREDNADALRELEGPGFVDVLQRAIRISLDAGERADGTNIAKISETINSLECANDVGLLDVWEDLKEQLKTVEDWGEFKDPIAAGIKIVLTRIPSEQERLDVCKETATSLSYAKVPELEGDHKIANPVAQNWVDTSMALVQAINDPLSLDLSSPGSPAFKTEIMQQLSELNIPLNVKSIIKFSPEEISNGIISEVSKARYLRAPEKFVSYAKETSLQLNWKKIVQTVRERLKTGLDVLECRSLLNLMISSYSIAGNEDALKALEQLSLDGHLTNHLQIHQKNKATQAAILSAIFLSNPSFQRNGQAGESANGDTLFNNIVDNSAPDQNLVSEVASFAQLTQIPVKLYSNGARTPKIQKFIAAIIGALVKKGEKFDIEAQFIIDNRAFLEKNSNLNPPDQFLSQLTNIDSVLDNLKNQPFEVAKCKFYLLTKGLAPENRKEDFLIFLEKGIQNLPKDDWEKALTAKTGAYTSLVELCSDLQNDGHALDLGMDAKAALFDQIKKVEKEQVEISDENRARLDSIVGFLESGFHANLINNTIEDMVGSGEIAVIDRVIMFFGIHVSKDALTEFERKRIVNRIFNLILENPSEPSSAWMATILADWPDFLKGLDKTTKFEFTSRLQNAAGNLSLAESILTQIKDMAQSLNIEITLPEKPAEQEKATG